MGPFEPLLDPSAYPDERPARVTAAETHISWLFLTDRFVYKVKKPVDYGFLDFTTLDRRRFYCEEEVRLNRRLSPDVYLGVVEIRRRDGGLAVGGDGALVDYAVKMRRLPADRWLSRLLHTPDATVELARRIGRRIAAFHAEAETSDHIRERGGLEAVRVNTGENFEQTRDLVGVTLTRPGFDRVRAYTEAFIALREPLFRRREQEGRIRDCHGDLHADQICVENGLAFIDCIEFNQRFRFGDVAADVAFPAMDIAYHGRDDLAVELIDEYLRASGDTGLLDVLDFYRCYRAYTRGKVRSFRLRQTGLSEAERRATADQASRYFDLAARYATIPGPLLLAVGGLMGTGKTSLARGLASTLEAELVSSDVVRKAAAGVPAEQRFADPWGQGRYTPAARDRIYEEMHRVAALHLASGRVVVLDGSYGAARWRRSLRETADAAGAPLLFIEAACPDSVAEARLLGRTGDASDGRVELAERQRREFEPPVELPPEEYVRVDTEPPPEAVVVEAVGAVYRAWLGPMPRDDASRGVVL